MISAHLTREREALAAVISSDLFAAGSNAERFLRYVCERYFEDGGHSVNEYSIAVEALGRSSKFDPRQDAIVRVEAHRVRHRLQQYYAGAGREDRVQIILPPGKYVPQFVTVATPASPEPVAVAPAEAASLHSATKPTVLSSPRFAILVLAVLAITFTLVAVIRRSGARDQHKAGSTSVPPVVALTPADSVRILAGSDSAAYTDSFGHVWQSDCFFQGGGKWTVPYRRIFRTPDPKIFFTMRQGRDFGYDIPLKNGVYEMRLLFAETVFGDQNVEGGGESSRIFDVLANGSSILTDFDPLSDADGQNIADIRTFKDISPAADGHLHLRFLVRYPVKGNAFVNAIELTPGTQGIIRPLRWVASTHPFQDAQGQMWLPDQFFLGGRLRTHQEPITGTADPESFMSERFGHFSYSIPVPSGSYELTLKFAETWFGTLASGSTGLGANFRVFDLYCNGVALLRNFDVAKEAGGPDRALVKKFRGLRPNAQGKLLLSFIPIKDYASVNAIEVRDEADKSGGM